MQRPSLLSASLLRRVSGKRVGVLLAAAMSLSTMACAKLVDVQLTLLEPCDQEDRALNGVRTYRVETQEDGETNGAYFSPGNSTPIELGLGNTEISVFAWTDEGADISDPVKSVGHTVLPASPDDASTEPVNVSVLMGLVDSMGQVSSMTESGDSQCESISSGTGFVEGRHAHTATYIPQVNKVLVLGGAIWITDNANPGQQTETYLRTAELWDPATGVFTALPDLQNPRAYHTATLVKDANGDDVVFIAGGFSLLNQAPDTLTSGHLFYPSRVVEDAEQDACTSPDSENCPFSGAISLRTQRAMHTATRLGDNLVVLAGGCSGPGCASDSISDVGNGDPTDLVATVEVFNATTGESISADGLLTPRAMHAASILNSGGQGVLLSGGVNASGPVCTVELLRLSGDSIDNIDALSDPQRNLTTCPIRHVQVSLGDSRVAFIGGQTAAANGKPEGLGTDVVQFWNSAAGVEATSAQMLVGRVGHTAHVLNDGSILVYGGSKADIGGPPAERLELQPGTTNFIPSALATPPSGGAFDRAAAAELPNNQIFVSGGHNDLTSSLLQSTQATYLYFGE